MLWAYVEPDSTVGQLHLEVLRLDWPPMASLQYSSNLKECDGFLFLLLLEGYILVAARRIQ